MSYDRFKHEEAIMDAWGVVEDFKLLAEAAINGETKAEEIAAMALGMSLSYQLKFEKLFDQFEQSITTHADAIQSKEFLENFNKDDSNVQDNK